MLDRGGAQAPSGAAAGAIAASTAEAFRKLGAAGGTRPWATGSPEHGGSGRWRGRTAPKPLLRADPRRRLSGD